MNGDHNWNNIRVLRTSIALVYVPVCTFIFTVMAFLFINNIAFVKKKSSQFCL
jgi:hypothetical protein